MRNINFAPGEYYHVFGRGVRKSIIFQNDFEYARFIVVLLATQSDTRLKNYTRNLRKFLKDFSPPFRGDTLKEIAKWKNVELVAFCLMPNHFHLILREKREGGISDYMQRVLTSTAQFINTKYKISGHVFEGPYKAVHIENNRQMLHASAYIHRNPRELRGFKNKEEKYRWSSYRDFIDKNRFPTLLKPDVILEQFKDKKAYKKFVETSSAKDLDSF